MATTDMSLWCLEHTGWGNDEGKTERDQLPVRKGSNEVTKEISLAVSPFVLSPFSCQAFEGAQVGSQ